MDLTRRLEEMALDLAVMTYGPGEYHLVSGDVSGEYVCWGVRGPDGVAHSVFHWDVPCQALPLLVAALATEYAERLKLMEMT